MVTDGYNRSQEKFHNKQAIIYGDVKVIYASQQIGKVPVHLTQGESRRQMGKTGPDFQVLKSWQS